MNTFQFTGDELDQLRAFTAPWSKIISRRVFGEEGPSLDVDFRAMEQIATAAAQGLTEGTLELLLRQQAKKLPDQQPCPDCGWLCTTEPSKRSLTARGAELEQVERVAHCPDCRRDFFPPTGSAGTR